MSDWIRIRLAGLLASMTLMVALIAGCSGRYEDRLNSTLDQIRYTQKLDANLQKAESDPFEKLNFYFRPPVNVAKSSGNVLTASPGMFDIVASYIESSKDKAFEAQDKVHFIARRKQAPPAAGKKSAAPAGAEARKEFVDDTLNLFPTVSNALRAEKPKDVSKRGNNFKMYVAQVGERTVELYLNATPKKDYEAIIVVDRAIKSGLTTQINLMLEAFASGEKAVKRFQGNLSEDESGGVVDESGGGAGF